MTAAHSSPRLSVGSAAVSRPMPLTICSSGPASVLCGPISSTRSGAVASSAKMQLTACSNTTARRTFSHQ